LFLIVIWEERGLAQIRFAGWEASFGEAVSYFAFSCRWKCFAHDVASAQNGTPDFLFADLALKVTFFLHATI
jgi:hypothetical protein